MDCNRAVTLLPASDPAGTSGALLGMFTACRMGASAGLACDGGAGDAEGGGVVLFVPNNPDTKEPNVPDGLLVSAATDGGAALGAAAGDGAGDAVGGAAAAALGAAK